MRRPTPHPHRVLIVGGGFGGLSTAEALRLVHVRYLVGWANRLITTLRWLWTMLARHRSQGSFKDRP